jgi:hypothetical protein
VDQRPRTLADAAEALIEAYQALTRRAYARTRPTGGRDTADSLNNRAVSLIDLGRSGADALWARALRADPQHLESSYNQALHAWTFGRIGDEELLARVQAAETANATSARAPELLAQARQAGEGAPAAEARAIKLDGAAAVAVAGGGQRFAAFARNATEVRVFGADGSDRSFPLSDLKPRALALAADGSALATWPATARRGTWRASPG